MALDLLRWLKHNIIPSSTNGWKIFQHGQLLYIDYKITPKSRYGHGKPPHPRLYEIIINNRETYTELLRSFSVYYDRLVQISEFQPDTGQPTFYSRWYTGYDAMSLYSIVRRFKPKHYIEVGSGNSTHFARMAAKDERLDLKITAIDAQPRREIYAVADTLIQSYLEEADLNILQTLRRMIYFSWMALTVRL